MHRIDTTTAQKDKWGAGKNGWTNGDPATGVKATSFNASFCDAIQEEICNAIEKSGLALDPEDNTQLFRVLSKITTGMGDYLAIKQNLAEIAAEGAGAQSAARTNLGLKTAATHDVQESRDDTTSGRVLVNGGALALRTVAARAGTTIADASALPANSVSFCYADAAYSPGYEATILDVGGLGGDGYRVQYAASYGDGGKRLKFRTLNADNGYWGSWTNVITNYGGSVAYLDSATYYQANPNVWFGAGAFADQYGSYAPFNLPYGHVTPKGISQYLPLIKGVTSTSEYGFGSAVSFGILRTGNNDFGTAVVHIIGDNGSGSVFQFDTNGGFNAPHQIYSGGSVDAAGQISSGGNIVAGQGLYESGGAVRVYSSNNPPPVNGVQNIALGAAGWYQVGSGTTEAPPGCLLTGGGDFGASDGSYYYRPLQVTFNGYNWYTVSLLGATQNVLQLSQSDVEEISIQPYALSSISPVLSKFSLSDSPVLGIETLNNAAGFEWYRVRNNLDGQVFIAYHEDTGIIEQISENVQALWPVNLAVAALDSLPEGCDILGTWVFDPATMTVSQMPSLIASKNKLGPYRKLLRAAGDAYMLLQLLPPDDAEEKITELKAYLAALQSTDLTQNNPAWPSAPDFVN